GGAATDAAPGLRLRAQPRLAHAPPRPPRAVAHAAASFAGARAVSGAALDRGRLARQEGAARARAWSALDAVASAAAALRRLAVVGHDATDSGAQPDGVLARTMGTGRLPARQGGRADERSLVGLAEIWPCLSLRRRRSRC